MIAQGIRARTTTILSEVAWGALKPRPHSDPREVSCVSNADPQNQRWDRGLNGISAGMVDLEVSVAGDPAGRAAEFRKVRQFP